MRFVRFVHPARGGACWAEVQGDRAQPLSAAPWAGPSPVGEPLRLASVELLAPAEPTKIVCIGQNYRQHAEEMGKVIPPEPLLFLKPPSALNPPGAPIRLPPESEEVHHEAELALVIGRRLSRATEAEVAAGGIFGLSCFNDVTARDIQRREVQHTRGKGYDTFACLGPELVTGVGYDDLAVRCRVNGALRQEGRTSDMAFGPARLVAFISSVMTLEPGDVISTGTPSGVGRLVPGDVVEVEVESVGVLRNPVAAAGR